MPFNQKPQKFNAKINAVTIGSGDKTVTIGGENSFPFYTFDAPTENTPKIGVEISDLGLDEFSEGVKAYYEGATSMADIAKKQQLSKAQILLPSSLTVEIRTG